MSSGGQRQPSHPVPRRDERDSGENHTRRPLVLVVDDDREMLRGLGLRLNAAGFNVLTAFDGRRAIEAAVKHRPDVILMDNYMPGMDGLEALNRLAEKPDTVGIPVIMLSASNRDQHRALEQGARFFLQKPCDPGTLLAALKEAIDRPTRRQT